MSGACKHCGRQVDGGLHLDGRQRGLGRCDSRDSGLPYGYNAETADEPCSIACLGSAAPRCICSSPGASIQCVACYPDLGRRYNATTDSEPRLMTAEHAHGIDGGGEFRTKHPLCTELGCECSGNLQRTGPNPAYVAAGAAVCMCHPAQIAASLGIERFACVPEMTRHTAADAVLAEARRLCCGENPAAHHAASAKHSERMAFAEDLARAVRGA